MNAVVATFTVNADGDDFRVNDIGFRFYRDTLWSDGGEGDDLVIRKIDSGDNATIEIEITEKDFAFAKSHQEEIAEEVE